MSARLASLHFRSALALDQERSTAQLLGNLWARSPSTARLILQSGTSSLGLSCRPITSENELGTPRSNLKQVSSGARRPHRFPSWQRYRLNPTSPTRIATRFTR